jgi:uncharacterized protein (TIGR00251 family)
VAVPWIELADGDVLIAVWVVPGASQTGVVGPYGEALKVRVAAPPERGRANREVERLLSRILAPGSVCIESGHGSRTKRFRVTGLGPDEVERRLAGSRGSAW